MELMDISRNTEIFPLRIITINNEILFFLKTTLKHFENMSILHADLNYNEVCDQM